MLTICVKTKTLVSNHFATALLQLGKISAAEEITLSVEQDEITLVATSERIFLFSSKPGPNDQYGTPTLIEDLAFAEITEFRTLPAVGAGLLQIRVDGIWLDLLRFENRNAFAFDQHARRLEGLRRGELAAHFNQSGQNEKDPKRCPDCGIMLNYVGELCPHCIDHGAALQRVTQLLRPYWKSTAVMMLFLFIGIGLDMFWPLLTRFLVDHVLVSPGNLEPQSYAFLEKFDARTLLILVVAALAGVHILRAGVNFVTGRIASRVGNAMTFDIRGKLVHKLEELGLNYYSRQETGSLVGRIAYDTDSIQGFISQITSGFFMQFFLVVISFLMMFKMDPPLALWAVVPAPAVIGGALVYWRYVHPHFQRYWDRSSKQAGLLNGILSGIRVVKAFAQEKREYDRFQETSMDVRRTREVLDRTAAYFYPGMGLVFQVGGWIIWYIGGQSVLQNGISLGTLMAFFGYLSMFYGPLGSLTNLTTWLTQFSTQVHRIFEVLDTPVEQPEARNPIAVPHFKGDIEFRNVTFGYTRGAPVLKNLSLHFKSGEKIGLVGRSGSGKTSLINLICRFYDVESGLILIDGVDIRDIAQHDLRARIGMVLQEPFLFRGTLHENIIYGKPQALPEEVIAAARAASAHDFVLQHPLGYDTSVGERGQELSGGERQRISIARAILLSPPILILDEATSSLDTESELAIQNALQDVAGKSTAIVIAHRLSTLQNCDRIYVLENGEILENGSHHELMEKSGRYASWVRIQQGHSSLETTAPETDSSLLLKKAAESKHPARWLAPETTQIQSLRRGEIQVRLPEQVYRGVFALRCFPVRMPDRYISLRHFNSEGRNEELGIIQNLSKWPEPAQDLIRESLNRRYFFRTIRRLHSVRKSANFLSVEAQTDTGRVAFSMRHVPESAKDFGKGGKLLIDSEENLYVIPDLQGLSKGERVAMDRYIYW